ncbi:MAG: VOC family protein [Spirochaetota bacterium]
MPLLRPAISLPVADAQVTARFYGAVFGDPSVSREAGTVTLSLPGVNIFFIEVEEFNLLLKPADGDARFSAETNAVMLTATVSTRDEAYAVLKAASGAGGVPCGQAVPYSWGLAAYFKDPDGHLWEVLWHSAK